MIGFDYEKARSGASVIMQDGTPVVCVFNDNDTEYPIAGTAKTDYGYETLHYTREGIVHKNAGRNIRLYMNYVQQELCFD